jgi:hypothetical protein
MHSHAQGWLQKNGGQCHKGFSANRKRDWGFLGLATYHLKLKKIEEMEQGITQGEKAAAAGDPNICLKPALCSGALMKNDILLCNNKSRILRERNQTSIRIRMVSNSERFMNPHFKIRTTL